MNKTIKFNKHLSKCKDIIMNELGKEILKDVVTELKQNDFCLKSKDIDIAIDLMYQGKFSNYIEMDLKFNNGFKPRKSFLTIF